MPAKIRELKAKLKRAGFHHRSGKGDHTVWWHPDHPHVVVVLSGNDGDDARESRKGSPLENQTDWGQAMKHPYSIVIQWSDEDEAYLVTLPEFGRNPQTHGDTYKEAIKRAQEVLETLIEFYKDEGRALPKPRKYHAKETIRRPVKRIRGHAATA